MYLPKSQFESGILRQGDILDQVPFFGAISLNTLQLVKSAFGEGSTGWQVSAPMYSGPAMVLSHSCEIAPENAVKVTSVILAPLRDLSKATDKSRREQLIASNLIDVENPTASFLKYFFLEPIAELPFSEGAVVDFSKCFSVRGKSYKELAARKIVQLAEHTANSMALKLALYFHRSRAA